MSEPLELRNYLLPLLAPNGLPRKRIVLGDRYKLVIWEPTGETFTVPRLRPAKFGATKFSRFDTCQSSQSNRL